MCEGPMGFEKKNPPKFFDNSARNQLGTNLGLNLPLIFKCDIVDDKKLFIYGYIYAGI